jgi:hypothetical protein
VTPIGGVMSTAATPMDKEKSSFIFHLPSRARAGGLWLARMDKAGSHNGEWK